MIKTSIILIIYIIGLIFGALFLDIWSAETSIIKGLIGLGWTALLLSDYFLLKKTKESNNLTFYLFFLFNFLFL